MKHLRKDYDRIQDPAGLIPTDEPVFLLRGQDPAAAKAIRSYIRAAGATGAAPAMLTALDNWAEEMADWAERVQHGPADVPDGMLRDPAEKADDRKVGICRVCDDGLFRTPEGGWTHIVSYGDSMHDAQPMTPEEEAARPAEEEAAPAAEDDEDTEFDVDQAAKDHHTRIMGHDRPIEERRDEARRLSASAPTVDRRSEVDEILRAAGIEFPLGPRGVSDLVAQRDGNLDRAREAEAERDALRVALEALLVKHRRGRLIAAVPQNEIRAVLDGGPDQPVAEDPTAGEEQAYRAGLEAAYRDAIDAVATAPGVPTPILVTRLRNTASAMYGITL